MNLGLTGQRNPNISKLGTFDKEIEMILKHYRDGEPMVMTEDGAHGVTKRVIIGSQEGATNFIMRVIAFEANAQSPEHHHPWEHEAFVISGRGIAEVSGKEYSIRSGDVFFIPADEKHCFKTTEPMEILCLIPTNEQGVE